MTKARRIGLMVLLLASGISVFFALILQRMPHTGVVDFRIIYLASRCMIEHRDPYSVSVYREVFQEQGGTLPADPVERQQLESAAMAVVYPPTALMLVVPVAALGWGIAQMIWTIITIGLFTLACYLIWSIAADNSLPVATALSALMLSNSEVLFAFGNAAGVAVSLCAIAVWCFFTGRFALVGAIFLAVSLAIKPHDTVAVWLFLLAAGGAYRKRAVQALIIACSLGVLAIVWTYQVSPHWIHEIRSNLELVSAKGGVADPGPAGISNGTGGMIIALQSAVSIFHDDPHFYGPVTWVICAPLLIVWLRRAFRMGAAHPQIWLALAAIAPLSMLPVYHRCYDAKILLLAVPACAAIWAEGGVRRWFAMVATTAAILVTSDLPSALLVALGRRVPTYPVGLWNKLVAVVITRPAPLILLAMSIFWAIPGVPALWAFRFLRIPVVILAAMIVLSTVTMGEHYMLDPIAGATVAVIAIYAAEWLSKIHRKPSSPTEFASE